MQRRLISIAYPPVRLTASMHRNYLSYWSFMYCKCNTIVPMKITTMMRSWFKTMVLQIIRSSIISQSINVQRFDKDDLFH